MKKNIYSYIASYVPPCLGDNGGPLVCDDGGKAVLAGVISSLGQFDCTTTHPSVYTEVTSILPWIKENMVILF